ncbi:hypothetical protein CL656_01910, partial [bacterium]|nr:hypothetical protein [bacterium]
MPNIKNLRKHLIILGLAALCFFAAYGIINQKLINISSAETIACTNSDGDATTCDDLQTDINNRSTGDTITIGNGVTLKINDGETIDCDPNNNNQVITIEIYNEAEFIGDDSNTATLKNCVLKKSDAGITANNGDLIKVKRGNVLIHNNTLKSARNSGTSGVSYIETVGSDVDFANLRITNNTFDTVDHASINGEFMHNIIHLIDDGGSIPGSPSDTDKIHITGNTSNIYVNKYGLYLQTDSYLNVSNNDISCNTAAESSGCGAQSTMRGIYCFSCYGDFDGNTIKDYYHGMYLEKTVGETGNMQIKNNILDNEHTDIHVKTDEITLGGTSSFKNIFLNTKGHTYFIDTNVNGDNISGSHNFFGDGNGLSGGTYTGVTPSNSKFRFQQNTQITPLEPYYRTYTVASGALSNLSGVTCTDNNGVCAGTPVQDEINSATSGETISIPAGTYSDTLTINKSLTISCSDNTDRIFTGTVSITASNVTITNCRFNNTVSANADGDSLTLTSNNIQGDFSTLGDSGDFQTNTFAGTITENGNANDFDNNTISNTINSDGTSVIFNNNTLNAAVSISGINPTFSNNTINSSSTVTLSNSSNNIDNNITSNTINGKIDDNGDNNDYPDTNTLAGSIDLTGATNYTFDQSYGIKIDDIYFATASGITEIADGDHDDTIITLTGNTALTSIGADITNSEIVCTNVGDHFNLTSDLTINGESNTLTNCELLDLDGNEATIAKTLEITGDNNTISGGSLSGEVTGSGDGVNFSNTQAGANITYNGNSPIFTNTDVTGNLTLNGTNPKLTGGTITGNTRIAGDNDENGNDDNISGVTFTGTAIVTGRYHEFKANTFKKTLTIENQNILVENNTFDISENDTYAIVTSNDKNIDELNISNNNFSHATGILRVSGIQLGDSSAASSVTIHDNIFSGNQENILHAKDNNNVTFTKNEINSLLDEGTGDGKADKAIILDGDANTYTIGGNDILEDVNNIDDFRIGIEITDESNFNHNATVIKNNIFANAGQTGVNNLDQQEVDAELNYWGADQCASIVATYGNGATVSANVDYIPCYSSTTFNDTNKYGFFLEKDTDNDVTTYHESFTDAISAIDADTNQVILNENHAAQTTINNDSIEFVCQGDAISNNSFSGAITVSSTGNTFTNCDFVDDLTINGNNITLSGGEVNGITTINGNNVVEKDNNITNVDFNDAITIDGSKHDFNGQNVTFAGLVTIADDGDQTILEDVDINAGLTVQAGGDNIDIIGSNIQNVASFSGENPEIRTNVFQAGVTLSGTNSTLNNIRGNTFSSTLAINESGHQFTTAENNFEGAVTINTHAHDTKIASGDFNTNATLTVEDGATNLNISGTDFAENVLIKSATANFNNNNRFHKAFTA